MEPWSEVLLGPLLAGSRASRPDGTGSTTWQLAKLGSWGFCCLLEEKKKRKELSFCRKVGVKVLHFHFYSFDVKNSQRSAVRMGPDTPRTVQGTADPPVAFWHLCCRLNVLFGCPGSSVSDLQPSLSHYRCCHNAPFPLWSWFSSIYSATLTCILVGFYVFLQINT